MSWAEESEKAVSRDYQKWDYITLDDFRSKSCGSVSSYIWLWYLVFVALAVYTLDTFTAVNLLAYGHFNQIQPAISIDIAKWIFAGCILFSFALCGYEWIIAIRVLRRGNVAESYLDPLASTLQSIRVGKGKGYKRFLVFAELTKSKKGADYVAIFCYFQFRCAIRIILAEGPRQVINAVTLYAAMKANLIPAGAHAAPVGDSNFNQFWTNVEILYDDNHEQALILLSMLISLIIWSFWAICLIIAILLYIFFLWSYIPKADGTLPRYCRRKIDSRLAKIVSRKVKQAIAAQEAKRKKAEEKAARKGTATPSEGIGRAPTLPSLMEDSDGKSYRPPHSLSRQTTQSSLVAESIAPSSDTSSMRRPTLPNLDTGYGSSSDRQPTLPNLADTPSGLRPSPLSRTETGSSGYSADSARSDRPLLNDAAAMGMGRPPVGRRRTGSSQSPADMPPMPQMPPPPMRRSPTGGPPDPYGSPQYGPPPFGRSLTGNSQPSLDGRRQPADYFSQGYVNGQPNAAMPNPNPYRPGPPTGPAYGPGPGFGGYNRPPVGRAMSNAQPPMSDFGPPLRRPSAEQSAPPSLHSREHSPSNSASFLPAADGPAYEMQPRSRDPSPPKTYQPYNPYANASMPARTASPAHFDQPRNPYDQAQPAISPSARATPVAELESEEPLPADDLPPSQDLQLHSQHSSQQQLPQVQQYQQEQQQQQQQQQQPQQYWQPRMPVSRSTTNPPPQAMQPTLPQFSPPRRVGTAPVPGTAISTPGPTDPAMAPYNANAPTRSLTPANNFNRPAPYRPGWS